MTNEISQSPLFSALPGNAKVNVYVDGFNLYYGIKTLGYPELKWLDIRKLAGVILKHRGDMSIQAVKYFTAFVKGSPEKAMRQDKYIKALKEKSVEIITGKFQLAKVACKHCGRRYKKPEEKQTDVNIACSMLDDLYNGRFDLCLLISADSDLIEAIRLVRQKGKPVVVWAPPTRNSNDIKKLVGEGGYYRIFESTLRKCLLPPTLTTAAGRTLSAPPEWTKAKR